MQHDNLQERFNAAPPFDEITVVDYQSKDPDRTILHGAFPPPSLPLEVFGEFWGGWIKQQAASISVPADFCAAPLLAAAAGAVGNSRARTGR